MKNIRGKRQPLLFVATAVAFSLVVFNGGSSSKVLADTSGAKYQVGNTIRIAGNAWQETNSYSLVSQRNWYGIVVSVKLKIHNYSAWEYYIRYPNGYHNDYVAEQDVTNISASCYAVGNVARITNNAWSETNDYSLRNRHNLVGTIASARDKAYSISAC